MSKCKKDFVWNCLKEIYTEVIWKDVEVKSSSKKHVTFKYRRTEKTYENTFSSRSQ